MGNEKSSTNLVLSAEGESKQTISVRISNETLRQIHELLIEEKRIARESMLMEPSMTWIVEELTAKDRPRPQATSQSSSPRTLELDVIQR